MSRFFMIKNEAVPEKLRTLARCIEASGGAVWADIKRTVEDDNIPDEDKVYEEVIEIRMCVRAGTSLEAHRQMEVWWATARLGEEGEEKKERQWDK